MATDIMIDMKFIDIKLTAITYRYNHQQHLTFWCKEKKSHQTEVT